MDKEAFPHLQTGGPSHKGNSPHEFLPVRTERGYGVPNDRIAVLLAIVHYGHVRQNGICYHRT